MSDHMKPFDAHKLSRALHKMNRAIEAYAHVCAIVAKQRAEQLNRLGSNLPFASGGFVAPKHAKQ